MGTIENHDAAWHKRKRKIKKIKLFVVGSMLVIISAMLVWVYNYLRKDTYISYSEKADLNYRVNLKPNNFYAQNYLGENTNVIAQLIKDIEVEFKYNLDFERENAYIYDYKITARTEVKENKKTNLIYEKEEDLLVSAAKEVKNKTLTINENIDVDYNKYNELISRFVNIYDLDDTNCVLELNMYLNVYNKYDNTEINKDAKVMTLYVPLTTKTVEIYLSKNTVKDEGQVLERKSTYGDIVVLKLTATILGLVGFVTLLKLVKFIIDRRSAEKMYDQKLKGILFNYKQYIQKINNDLDKGKYKIIEVEEFSEILEMKETLQAPILMYSEPGERKTTFMIINNDLLFIYILSSQDIREKLIEKSKLNKQ